MILLVPSSPVFQGIFAVFDMKIPPEYSEFCFYSVYSRGSISLHQNGAVFLDWFYALCFAAGAFSWEIVCLIPGKLKLPYGPSRLSGG